jgi:flagellar protein FlgJ
MHCLLRNNRHFHIRDFCRWSFGDGSNIAATGYRLFTEMRLNPENTTEEEEMMTPVLRPTGPAAQAAPPNPLREKAAQLETAFLAEMLGHAGLGDTRQSFGGGIGEEQFSSFLRQEQAAAIVRAGGIGLTESLFRALGGDDGGA